MKKFRIWFYPPILFFAIFMISACSFGNQGGARLCITLPYGTSRQADGEEYNFEIKIQKKLGHTLFSQKGKSGDTISFLLPTGQYIVEGIAWNQSGTVYVARENTSIKDDDDVFVTLSMKNYSSTPHASASPDSSNGIKITMKHLPGEGDWLIEGDSFIEITTESGRYDRIRFTSAPSDTATTLDYYYPFTKAGEICYFKLTLATQSSGGARSTEEFAAVAGGGRLNLFTDYDPSKIKLTLDSNGIVRMSDNPMKCLNESKLNQFDQLYFDFGVWGINSDKYDWSSWVATNLDAPNNSVNIVVNGSKNTTTLDRFLSNGLSIPEIIAADTAAVYRSRNYSKYFVSASCTCIFNGYPYQHLITSISENVSPIRRMPAINFPSQTAHVKAEPDAKGIKLTFDFSDKPIDTTDETMFHLNISEPDGFIIDSDFTLASGVTSVEYFYPLTESGKSYTLDCIASCENHDSLFNETVASNAGGGVLKTLIKGTPSDITMTLEDDGSGGKNIKLSKDPSSIFDISLLETCHPFFDFYGTNQNEPEKDWNYIGNFNNGDDSIADLLSGTLPVSNVKLDSASGNRFGFFKSAEAANYSNCWIKGGVSFSLNAYPDEYFVFQGKGFSTTGNIVVSMTDITSP